MSTGEPETPWQQAETVLETIGEIFYALDTDFRFTYVNHRAEAIWNRTRDELLGKNFWEVFPATVGTESHRQHLHAMQERHPLTYEMRSVLFDRWIEVTIYPAPDGGLFVYFRDIHDRKQSEADILAYTQALTTSEARYRRLLETALEGILFLDSEATITYVNQRFAQMLGYDSPADIIGHKVFWLFFPADAERAQASWAARQAGVQEEYELRLRRRDNAACWVIAHVSVERDETTNAFRGTFTMFTDITARRRAEESLIEAEVEIRESAHRQRRFMREILASVTEGKLLVCDTPEDLPAPLTPTFDEIVLTSENLRPFRQQVMAVAASLGFSSERTHDILTAAGEASMNAVRHAGGGVGRVLADAARGIIQIRIWDTGQGIREEELHRATLEKGYSSAGTLGHGFHLMLRTVDRTYLLTGANGTTIVIEQNLFLQEPAWLISQEAVVPHKVG